jgi:hypothetical protein
MSKSKQQVLEDVREENRILKQALKDLFEAIQNIESGTIMYPKAPTMRDAIHNTKRLLK